MWKWKSAVYRFSRRNNYSHNIKCLRKVEFYMRIGYSWQWNLMRIWHFKLRNIRRYAAYLGHWTGVSRWVVCPALGEMLCLKLLPQFKSHLNQTSNTWSLCYVDVHDILSVRPNQNGSSVISLFPITIFYFLYKTWLLYMYFRYCRPRGWRQIWWSHKYPNYRCWLVMRTEKWKNTRYSKIS